MTKKLISASIVLPLNEFYFFSDCIGNSCSLSHLAGYIITPVNCASQFFTFYRCWRPK